MKLSFNPFTATLNIAALVAVLFVWTGCKTTNPEPVFEAYDPGVWTPPAEQTMESADAEPEAEVVVPIEEEEESSEYAALFRVGDVVNVTITGVRSEEIPPHLEQIKDDGTIHLYLVGSVKAAGHSPGGLQRELQMRYEVYFKSPVVTVKAFERYYYVGGEVKMPGAQPYLGETTVTKAIQAARDFTDFAKKTNVRVIRADGTSLKVNFKKAIQEPSLDPPIYPGDKIHVPRRILW